jgi:DNA-directed RNA polymerase
MLELVSRSRNNLRTGKASPRNCVGLLHRTLLRRFVYLAMSRGVLVDHLKKVLGCISDLFSGAKSIQTWLNICARLISKSIPHDRLPEVMAEPSRKHIHPSKGIGANRLKKEQMTSVVWTTPMGLPIVQPYRKTKRKQIMTALQTVFISDPNSPAEGKEVLRPP